MTKGEIAKFLILRTIGNFLLLFSLFGVVATFGPVLFYELNFRVAQAQGITYKVADVKGTSGTHSTDSGQAKGEKGTPLGEITREKENPSQLPNRNEKVRVLVPQDSDFSIVIPRIGANAQVFPNVDPENEAEFIPILQQGIAHAKGTVFPGMKGNIYMFAHSTDNFWNVGRYNALFYLLKDVQVGDDIHVFFENVRHNYTVVESKIIDQEEVSYITQSQQQQEETLLLQTCWPPGTTWKRLLIVAKPK